jgi:hypothetical protein
MVKNVMPRHPLAFVPATVYPVVDAGVTIKGLVITGPGAHVYVPMPPEAVIVALWPEHIDNDGTADIVIVGVGLTVIVITVVAVHPEAFVPVRV